MLSCLFIYIKLLLACLDVIQLIDTKMKERKIMKKLLFIAIPMIITVLFVGCATAGSRAPENPVEEAFYEIYQRFRGDLILTGSRTHTVSAGDTLVGIARNAYDDGFYYPIIILASSNVVLDPDRIEPGMRLTIPDLQRNLNDTRARANIRNFLLEMADLEESRNRSDTARGLRSRANAL